MSAYFKRVVCLMVLDLAYICCRRNDNGVIMAVAIAILFLLVLALFSGVITLRSNHGGHNGNGGDRAVKPKPSPPLPDYSGIPECLRDYDTSPVDLAREVLV